MFCTKCGKHNGEESRFCRQCGATFETPALASRQQQLVRQKQSTSLLSKDPDELTSNGIGSVIMGDGFLMVAVILSATHSAVSSLLWLFLLIPAFFFFGKGFADVLHARQIRRSSERREMNSLPPSSSIAGTFGRPISGELVVAASVTERTTRDLG
jgi:hypothetical protein